VIPILTGSAWTAAAESNRAGNQVQRITISAEAGRSI
jgi:hypothetical protein